MNDNQHNTHKKISNLNKDLDIDIAKTVLKKNWFYIPLIVFVGLALGYIYLRYTKPIYESSAIIQRTSKDEGKRILEIENFEQETNLSEDVELLKSTYLLEKALVNLNLRISYFSEGDILTEEKYLQSPYHITLLELKDSSLIGQRIDVLHSNNQTSLSYVKNGSPVNIIVNDTGVTNHEHLTFNFKVNDMDRFKADVNDNKLYLVLNDYKELSRRMFSDLNVAVVNPDAKTLKISYKSNNAQLASDVVSSVISTFFKYDLDKKSESSANILQFIDDQMDTVYNQLKISETDIQSFRDSSNSKDPEYYKEHVISQIDILQSQYIDAELEFELLKDIDFGVNSKNRMEVYNLIPVISGTRFQFLLEGQLNKLHDLLESKEDATYGMTEENDNIKKINRNIDIQIETVNRTISSIKKQVKNKKEGIEKKINELESKLYGVPAKEMELSRLKRKFNLNEKYYSLLIEKRTQYEISKAGYTMDNLILQEPSVPVLISPKKNLIYIGIFVLSFLVSILVLVLKYVTFNVIHNESELKKLVPNNIGFLGVVPKAKHDKSNSILMVHENPKSILSETFRNIRTNLQFILDSKKTNVLAISSSISGEGKTFVALNLAGIFTMSSKKVIIIDLDLRKPKIHLGFDRPNNEGMSSILAKKANWKDCVQHSELENLHFISAGTIPPNPSELIISGELERIVEEMKQEYDLVMIDNPPVGIVSDGVGVLNNADCAIYVFRANYSKRIFANRVRELLNEDKVSNLYMVLNDVEMSKSSYGYGYGYGGYYEEEKPKKKKFFNRKK